MIIKVDKSVYSREAITATVYRFSGEYNVSVENSDDSSDKYAITLNPKDENKVCADVQEVFTRELIDQQVRLDIEERFGHIRDLIVEEAFKPVTKR